MRRKHRATRRSSGWSPPCCPRGLHLLVGDHKYARREPPCDEFAPNLDHPPNAGPPRYSLPSANKALLATSTAYSAEDLSLEKLLR